MNKVLVFAPHFDDESIACGGTIAKHVQTGNKVSIVFMTNGESGSTLQQDLGFNRDEYGKLRKQEAADAMKVLGVSDFDCLDLEEGFMCFTPQLEKQLITIIRSLKPDIVYIPHEGDSHNDHIITSLAVKRAIRQASWTYFPHLGVNPHRVSEIRAYEVWTPLQHPNLYIDITDQVSAKEAAIKCYKSQLIHHQYHRASLGLNQYRGIAGAGVEFAEAFEVDKMYDVE